LLAEHFRLEGKTSRALAELQAAQERGWPEVQVARARLLIRARKEFAQVEPDLQALLDVNPDDPAVLQALSLGWLRARSFSRAEKLINTLLVHHPDDGAALYIRGRIFLQSLRPHQARPDLEKAFQLGTDRYYAYDARASLGDCLLELGQFEEAEQRYRECLAEQPGDVDVRFGLGRCAWYLNRWDEAADAFRAVLRQRPDHVQALSQLAYIHEERGELPEALELLERAVRHQPGWYDLHFRMAKILQAQGRTKQAAEHRALAEKMKQHWAKPRSEHSPDQDLYTGVRRSSLRGSTGR
ncbi:MAG TPA: tetratricopeptide repeat protein, partial [Gemmataceae bacterium]|nr:tetratricopeptide repeat protein [Gemmataceae bacterium]